MERNAVMPNVVLHFHGFRFSMLSNLEEALCHLAVDMLRKMIVATAASGACIAASQAASMAVPVLTDGLVSGLITFATFSSCTVLAHGPARLMHKQQQQLLPSSQSYYLRDNSDNVTAAKAAAVTSTSSSTTLPLLSTKRLAPISYTTMTAPTTMKQSPKLAPSSTASKVESSSSNAPSLLPQIRRRVLNHLRQGPPIVNTVANETRRRAHMSLVNATIRVGKAHTQLRSAATNNKPLDVYMVRVDCGGSSGTSNEKHMNPVVMWDITATFDEFKALERDLKREVRAKKLGATVPHLSTGAVLFVQEELTQHVLNARRVRLQTFIDAIRTDAELATTDALRKFCQAY